MYKKFILVVLSIVLSGCASSSLESKISESKESMLVETNNYANLVSLYKQSLKEKEDVVTRIKLAKAYANLGDHESSLFVIQRVKDKAQNSDALKVECNALFELGDIKGAESCLLKVISLDKNNAEVENQLGIVYAYLGDIPKAKAYFELSREHFIDDVKIKNNLAMINMLEGKFNNAVSLLLPIYTNDKSNGRVEANLVFSLVKIGELESAKKILAKHYSDKEIDQIVRDISTSQSVSIESV
ncbi:hypothetical protein EK599_03320 [Vibrio sp. T187]|uniref:tetratricopeptide repeat protein n=1 Tax=Vibrio TaxID=662 RepID=UPI0010C9F351|nr:MULTISPECIES: hypothetical protein [Vibrio]MBW3694708.1 hypothetical protein [Vibrio sp. T187]